MSDTQNKTITIGNTEYQVSDLSRRARSAAVNINTTDAELRRLKIQLGIAQTARKVFADVLRNELAAVGEASRALD